MNTEYGILYVTTGQRFVDESIQSVKSVKELMPSMPAAIFKDKESSLLEGFFDIVSIITNPAYSFLDKIEPLINTPFRKTLYLDADTVVIGDLEELFVLLDRFDLAAAHAQGRN